MRRGGVGINLRRSKIVDSLGVIIFTHVTLIESCILNVERMMSARSCFVKRSIFAWFLRWCLIHCCVRHLIVFYFLSPVCHTWFLWRKMSLQRSLHVIISSWTYRIRWFPNGRGFTWIISTLILRRIDSTLKTRILNFLQSNVRFM